ncbi:reticulon-2a isoform X2 [Lepisosteus oculatus]|uniref:reticulon-2a isoform X2 n=1 Tax=Lepisosteus oculatus TaxID=7918 RepID=UPI0037135955
MGPDGAGWSMGQVLGFAHCKESGSVSTTPDSTPPSTEGGNEESDFPDLHTAREWSEDEEEGEDGQGSPSVWGTPRQSSYELTFSYIAFSEPEGGGTRRRRGRAASGMSRTDTVETLLPESPQADTSFQQWDPAFSMGTEEAEGGCCCPAVGRQEAELPLVPPMELRLQPSTATVLQGGALVRLTQDSQVSEPSVDSLTRDTWVSEPSVERLAQDTWDSKPSADRLAQDTWVSEPSADSERMTPGDSSPVLLHPSTDAALSGAGSVDMSSTIGQSTQEEPNSERWFTAFSQSEGHVQVAVSELIYWKDAQRTGVVFTGLVVSLIALSQLSIISVGSNLAFAVLCVTITLRLYYKTLQALHKSDGANPFQWYLDYDISVSKELTQRCMDRVVLMATTAATELRRLFLVDNFLDSFKFALLMYLLTYIGAVFNGLTLLIMAVICAFSLPLLYRQHQTQIDQYMGLVTGLITDITNKIQAKIPSAKPKEQ